ncbi:hypothetical protein M0534_10725 [Methylonatrum kenyense]|uniref:hypothetical protein n=1 Tax=Methylonatrum kenyense TaxID=455253 RepID=UPI0020BF79DC|nr:hypothetical protein [Methylonatrum kenyense]MCK8516790.1 hypothetical protein [Methylonatrum kenyense]
MSGASESSGRSVLVAEPMRCGEEHQPFNASLLLMCLAAFPGHTILFAAESAHLRAIRAAITDTSRIRFLPVDVAERRATGARRLAGDWGFAGTLRHILRDESPERLILSSVTRELLWALRARVARGGLPPTLAIFHAGLADAVRQRKFYLSHPLLSLRSAIVGAPRDIRFAVLEESIRAAVALKDEAVAARIGVLPHPLPPDLLDPPEPRKLRAGGRVRIGLLGLCSPQKGLFRFLEMAKYARESGYDDLRFEIVGRLHEDVVDASRNYLAYLDRWPSCERIPRGEYVDAVRNLDLAAFLFQGKYYELTASGVLLDCIALGVPLLAMDSPLFRALNSQVGRIGLMVDAGMSHEEVLNLVRSTSKDQYAVMNANLSRLRELRMPDYQSRVLSQNLFS